jgi:hypothetical protein
MHRMGICYKLATILLQIYNAYRQNYKISLEFFEVAQALMPNAA